MTEEIKVEDTVQRRPENKKDFKKELVKVLEIRGDYAKIQYQAGGHPCTEWIRKGNLRLAEQ